MVLLIKITKSYHLVEFPDHGQNVGVASIVEGRFENHNINQKTFCNRGVSFNYLI